MKKIFVQTINCLALSAMMIGLISCVGDVRKNPSKGGSSSTTNINVPKYYGRVLLDNPIILSGNDKLPQSTNLAGYLSKAVYITDQQFLISDCTTSYTTLSDCFKVVEDYDAELMTSSNSKWSFNVDTSEFLQVQTFYHLNKVITNFQTNLESYYDQATPLSPTYETSIPTDMYFFQANWRPGETLIGYADCDNPDNASYDPASFSICFGYSTDHQNIKMVQDPTIIYHEMGHGFSQIMLNMRNTTASTEEEVDLGYDVYDEAAAIGEGLSDYHSYATNLRPHFAEWGVGASFGYIMSRPLTESDDKFNGVVAPEAGSRYSYPEFLGFNPDFPDEVEEEIHTVGMIFSHYLYAQTQDFVEYCDLSEKDAIKNVMYLLTETMSELGDLTSLATDSSTNPKINLNEDHALEWIRNANPINFRSFTQKFAKYLLQIYSEKENCNGISYPQDRLEQLLDEYGLLLFDNYNQDGNGNTPDPDTGTAIGSLGPNTQINQANRLYSTLVPKSFIQLDATNPYYIFDRRSDMQDVILSLQSSGLIGSLSPLIASDLPYNNTNGRVSPGEVVGIFLNLYNNSNSEMAGIQVLANDWDHMKDGVPCSTFEDQFPSEGATDTSTTNPVAGDCGYISRNNGDDDDPVSPICFVQINEDDATKWVSQSELMSSIGLNPERCLSGAEKTDDCFVRAIKGKDKHTIGKLAPQSTRAKTFTDATPTIANFAFFETNPWIPPGTQFNCRFRVRFSNCSDCYTDPLSATKDDFLDYEYSGNRPFKIINVQFTVLD